MWKSKISLNCAFFLVVDSCDKPWKSYWQNLQSCTNVESPKLVRRKKAFLLIVDSCSCTDHENHIWFWPSWMLWNLLCYLIPNNEYWWVIGIPWLKYVWCLSNSTMLGLLVRNNVMYQKGCWRQETRFLIALNRLQMLGKERCKSSLNLHKQFACFCFFVFFFLVWNLGGSWFSKQSKFL